MSIHPAEAPDEVARRACPKCDAELEAQRDDSGPVRILAWRCACGWRRMVAESGVVTRKKPR